MVNAERLKLGEEGEGVVEWQTKGRRYLFTYMKDDDFGELTLLLSSFFWIGVMSTSSLVHEMHDSRMLFCSN